MHEGQKEGGEGGGGQLDGDAITTIDIASLEAPTWEEDPPHITKELLVVPEVGEVGMLLRGVLSPEECAHFISEVENTLAMVKASNSSKYRNCFRCEVSPS